MIITIDKVKYNLDETMAKNAGALTEIHIHKSGNIYIHNGEFYILAMPNYNEYNLICLNDGIRWSAPIKATSPNKLTNDEWEDISRNGNFKLIRLAPFSYTLI